MPISQSIYPNLSAYPMATIRTRFSIFPSRLHLRYRLSLLVKLLMRMLSEQLRASHHKFVLSASYLIKAHTKNVYKMTAPKDDKFVPHPVKEQFPGVEFCVNSNPPWAEAAILAFQHYLVMLGTIVLISSIIVPPMGGSHVEKAYMIQTMLFVAGVNTLLQTLFGTRLPVVIGGSFRFVIPMLYIALQNRYSFFHDPVVRFHHTMRAMQGALLISSILPILLGFLGIWRIVVRFLSPLSAVPLVTLVGLGLYAQGFPLLAECVEIGLPELILLVLFSQYFYGNFYGSSTSSDPCYVLTGTPSSRITCTSYATQQPQVQVLTQTLEEMQEKHEMQQREIEEMKMREESQRKELEDLKAKNEAETQEMKKTIATMMKYIPNMPPPT